MMIATIIQITFAYWCELTEDQLFARNIHTMDDRKDQSSFPKDGPL
jgi:hypothetical protein